MIEKTPSGLFVCLPDPPPPEEPAGNALRCARCQAPSTCELGLIGHRTMDGFHIESPTCGHGKFLLCPTCRKEDVSCPVCGCLAFFC